MPAWPPKGGDGQTAMQPNKEKRLPVAAAFFYWTDSQQNDAGVMAGLDGLVVPGGYLDLSNVGLAQQEHGQTGLADTAADGEGELVLQQQLVEGEFPAAVAAGGFQLPVQGGGVHPDAHGGELNGPAQQVIPQKNVPVEGPVVVVRGPAVVGLAGLQGPADADEEGGGMVLH